MFDDSKLPETRKKICWKSWNASVDEHIEMEKQIQEELEEELQSHMGGEMPFLPIGPDPMQKILYTPIGMYPLDSSWKPSDRWDCWIGSTNFSITHGIKETLSKIEGIEALRIIGRYTFFIGIASLFDFKNVRPDVEKKICGYSEKEVLSNEETQATVDLMKEQLKGNKYWSILVAPTGKVDYVVSDNLDQAYLDGLGELLELKQRIGGIILRGDHG
mgnify:CR=1 FL=1